MYRYYCTHGCVCQLVIKENGGGGGIRICSSYSELPTSHAVGGYYEFMQAVGAQGRIQDLHLRGQVERRRRDSFEGQQGPILWG